MASGARNVHELFERAALSAGMNLILVVAAAMTVLSFFGLPMWAAVVAVAVGAIGLATGVAVHLGARRAQRERNRRHREWLGTLPDSELGEFRADLAAREDAVDSTRGDWLRPLGAAALTMVTAVLVPYELIGAHSPNPLVAPINTVWVAGSIVLGTFCLVTAIVAAAHKDPSEPADDLDLGRDDPRQLTGTPG